MKKYKKIIAISLIAIFIVGVTFFAWKYMPRVLAQIEQVGQQLDIDNYSLKKPADIGGFQMNLDLSQPTSQ